MKKELKQKQRAFILKKLQQQGFISRNNCLENYLSRLGAYMNFLKDQGFRFEARYIKRGEGKDYIYVLYPRQKTRLNRAIKLLK